MSVWDWIRQALGLLNELVKIFCPRCNRVTTTRAKPPWYCERCGAAMERAE